jgi:hypothetical protein
MQDIFFLHQLLTCTNGPLLRDLSMLRISLVILSLVMLVRAEDVFVDPVHGDDSSDLASCNTPLKTVYAARDFARSLLTADSSATITVQLLPGTHHIGDTPLELGLDDAGVVWRSADPNDRAVVGAPIKVTGWKPHATVKNAFSAPLPSNFTKGSALRQFWVNGRRAERPRIYGHGRQQGDNRNGYCLNLTNATATKMYPEGSQFDFSHENATDPSKWPNPGDVEFV